MKRSLLRLVDPASASRSPRPRRWSPRASWCCCGWRTSDGTVGYGEAAPFEPYDGVPLERAIAALSSGGRGRRPPQARAAEEIARLDLDARREERPLAEPGADALPVNLTLAGGPPEEVAERAREGLRDGYRLLQAQGRPARRRGARGGRARGDRPVAGAARGRQRRVGRSTRPLHAIRALEQYDLEFVEQPCRTLEELAEVRAAGVHRRSPPTSPWPRARAMCAAPSEPEACDVVNVKLAGARRLRRSARGAARGARRGGMDAFLSSTLDGPWGIAAALQLAAAEDLPLACGLATLELFDSPLARALPHRANGPLKPCRAGPASA